MENDSSQEKKNDGGGKVSALKDYLHDVTDANRQADECTKATKAIGEHVGRVHGKEMKSLVLHLQEGNPKEPDCPSDSSATEKDKAVWGKLHDWCLKKQEVCDDYKAKVFAIVMSQCAEVMKNRVEGTTVEFVDTEAKYDVIRLLKTIKSVACGSDNKTCPHMQAGGALKQLVNMHQQSKETVLWDTMSGARAWWNSWNKLMAG